MIYGTRAKHLASFQVKDIPCPYCERVENQHVSVFGRYAHIMWIPLFPIGKKPVAECTRCKRTYDNTDFSETMQLVTGELSNRAKSPAWMWVGLMIMGGVFILSLIIGGIANSLPKDPRDALLNADINAMMAEPMADYDSTSVMIDNLMTALVVDELHPEQFTYLTKVRDNKALVLVNVPELKRLERSARPELLQTVQMIVENEDDLAGKDIYYGIMGEGARFMLIKTPVDSSYSTYAKKALLYDFYGLGEGSD